MLARWALATGRQSGEEIRGISEIDLPASLVPTFGPRVPIVTDINSGGAPDLLRDSFYTSSVGVLAGVVAFADTEFIALAKGDWELLFTLTTCFNYVNPFTLSRFHVSLLKPPLFGSQVPFLTHSPSAAGPSSTNQTSILPMRFVAALDDFRIRFHTPALAGGQNVEWSLFCLAHRMG